MIFPTAKYYPVISGIFAAIFLHTGFSSAQTFRYKNYSVEHGLASSVVYDILQDKKGFMWFATETGVSRFDGQSFRNYSTKNGLRDNTVLGIYEDRKGLLWFISLSGKIYYLKDERFHLLDFESKNKNIIVAHIMEDKNGDYWVGTYVSGLFKIRLNPGGGFQILGEYDACRGVYSIIKDRQGNIFATSYMGFVEIIRDSIVLKKYVMPDTMGYNWSCFMSNGDIIYGRANGLFLKPGSSPVKKMLESDKAIQFFYLDKEQHVWLATNKGAINLGSDLSSLQSDNLFFKNKSVSRVMEDREGNFWFSTLGEGVFFVADKEIIAYTVHDGLADNKINVIRGDREGNIWLGADNGNVQQWQNGMLKEWDVSLDNRRTNRVTCMLAHSDGSVWIGKDDGLAVIRNKTIQRITGRYMGSVKSITESRDGSVYAGTSDSFFKISNDSVREIRDSGRITAVFTDFRGDIWMCEKGKLGKYDGADYVFYDGKSPLLNQRTYHIEQSADSTFWLATQGMGLVFMKGETVKNISEADGLASDICNTFFIDDKNKTIWVATNKGLSKVVFQEEGYRIKNYTTVNGLISDEINSVYKQHDTVWVATSKGICFFDERKLEPNAVPPPVYFSSLQIMYADSAIRPSYELNYDKNNIRMEYRGLTYRTAGNVRYKYRMSGIDTSWVFTNYNFVQYPKLSPGEYTFLVSAMNEDRVWSEEPARMEFTVFPPYWETWWFRASAGFAFVSLVSGTAFWRVRRIRKREEEKTELNKRMAELEMTALRAQMNPHFVFNSLNSIQHLINANEKRAANEYLAKFSTLLRSVLDNAERSSITIDNELKGLELYLELEKLRFEEKFQYRFMIDEQIDMDNTEIPTMLIQPYIENAILHGFNRKEAGGIITIEMKKQAHSILCIVEDNGIGRKRAMELKKQSGRMHISKGMKITEERLLLLNKSKSKEVSLKITDLENEQGEAKGTRVEINIAMS